MAKAHKRAQKCIVCDDPITDANDSHEHIIPNAIGGRKKTKGFICGRCNNESGHKWDNALAEQLNALCLFFGITRQRGKSSMRRIESTAGEKFLMQPGGRLTLEKPSIQKIVSPNQTSYQITARTEEEARNMLKGLKRKHRGLDIEATLKGAEIGTSFPQGMMHFSISIGGPLSGRSIVKTAAALAHHVGIDTSTFNMAREYLQNPDGEPCFGYYYETDLVLPRPTETPFHCVAVSGNPITGLLSGYVEYFGAHRMIVCLSDAYNGEEINRAYAIDPTSGKIINTSVQLPFSKADVADIYAYKKIPDGALERAYLQIMPAAMKRQFEAENNRQISDAVDYAFKNCGAKPGDVLTQDQVEKLSSIIIQRMMPFIMHRVVNRPKR